MHKVKKGQNKKIVPSFRPDNKGKPFTILTAHKGYCQLLDTSANKFFFQNNNHILKVPTGQLQPLPAPVPFTHDPKIFIPYKGRVPIPEPENKIDFDENLQDRIPIHKPTRSQTKGKLENTLLDERKLKKEIRRNKINF